MNQVKKWKKILLIVVLAIVVIISGGIAYLKTQTYSPTNQAQQVAEQAEDKSDWL